MTTDDEELLPWRNVRGFSDGERRPTVVVVDDQAANVALLERVLTTGDIGVEVVGFTDPVAGLDHCRHNPPSLVLLDLHMPEMDGIEFMHQLRGTAPTPGVAPVLVLSADVLPEARARALTAGARDFVTKPFDRTEVLLRVANLLEISAFYDRLTVLNARLEAELADRRAVEAQAAAEAERRIANVDRALRPGGMAVVFQPIAEIATGRIMGVEALSRFSAEPQRTPDMWFDEAASVGRGEELELAALTKALDQLPDLPDGVFLAINLSPSTLMAAAVNDTLAHTPIESVVIELTEHTRIADYDVLTAAIRPLRDAGLRIAVDDTGAGYAGFESLLRLRPDILKLDTSLTRGIDADPIRRSLAAALVTFADQISAELIAEGIESDAELRTLRRIGIPWGQGYLLGAPASLPLPHRRVTGLPGVDRKR